MCSGWYSDSEQALLRRAASVAPTGDMLEIGVYKGLSARVLARYAGMMSPLYLVDNLSLEGADASLWPAGPDIVDITDGARPELPAISLLHHDADHGYDVVKADLEQYGPAVVPGGMIALHDFHNRNSPDVARAWTDWHAGQDETWDEWGKADTLQVFWRPPC